MISLISLPKGKLRSRNAGMRANKLPPEINLFPWALNQLKCGELMASAQKGAVTGTWRMKVIDAWKTLKEKYSCHLILIGMI